MILTGLGIFVIILACAVACTYVTMALVLRDVERQQQERRRKDTERLERAQRGNKLNRGARG